MLILMDTALSLLNVNEPVYPLDIVKNMRDQRPCMVQNVVGNILDKIEYSICAYNFTFGHIHLIYALLSFQFQYKFICECIFASYAKLTNTDVD